MAVGALAGITVVDLSRVLAGPYCTQMLGDHGADVIKVEPPGGDETRSWGPPLGEDGTAAYYKGVNRNKRGIVLDLRTAEGQAAVLKLLETADVLVENFKIGTLEKWGIGGEALPGAVSAAGALPDHRVRGRWAAWGFPGYDAAVQAMTGLMSVTGTEAGGATRIGVPVVDMCTGLNAAYGIMLALFDRVTSGAGQFIEVALFDVGLSINHAHVVNYSMSGVVPKRLGNAHPNVAPYDTFETGTVPIFLAVGNDGQFRKMCAQLGVPELAADPLFGSNVLRGANRDDLKARLEAVMASMDGAKMAEDLIRAGVPCGPVLNVAEAAAHPHTAHREMLYHFEGGYAPAAPVKLSRTPATYRREPPAYGEHTEEVLG